MLAVLVKEMANMNNKDLHKELSEIKHEIKKLNDKLDRHISFIETVYRGLRHPIDRVKDWFS